MTPAWVWIQKLGEHTAALLPDTQPLLQPELRDMDWIPIEKWFDRGLGPQETMLSRAYCFVTHQL